MAELSERPHPEWLRSRPEAQLADAQFDLARDFGFSSWRELKAHVDALTVAGRLIAAAKNGDAAALDALLDAHPGALDTRVPPYGATLLHAGARHAPVVEALLRRGLDPNARESGDNTTALHWAATITSST